MDEYIKRRDAMREIDHASTLNIAYLQIATLKAADAVEVKHGRWIHIKFTPHDQCSVCEKLIHTLQNFKYCPNCGARMDGE